MRRNEARQFISEDQITESPKPMEDRLTRIETEVADLRKDMKAANEAIAEVKGAVTTLRAEVNGRFSALEAEMRSSLATLRAEFHGGVGTLRGELLQAASALETKVIKWIVGTAIGCTALALTIAKTVS